MTKWKYFEPKFEYEEKFQDAAWPWVGHKFFAYDLVTNVKPKRIVELGTHYGTSLWSFCQAVKDHNIETELNAVDTWKGDKHAGFYGEEVFETVKQINNKYYPALKINLIRKTFDEALAEFEDNSVDILHIDGLHTYKAVKHDFESWLSKVKVNGIIIFHDIKVSEYDFGVYKFWDELRIEYSTIGFFHSFGLGVLFINKEMANEFLQLEKEMQMRYSYTHETNKSQNIQQKLHEIEQKNQEIQRRDREIEIMKASKF
jgi:hypothetical protein